MPYFFAWLRRIFCLLLVLDLAIIGTAHAQDGQLPNLRVLVIADASEAAWKLNTRPELEADRENVRSMFQNNVVANKLFVTVVPQQDINEQGILAAIDRLPAERGEVIVFYWSGHGITGRSDGEFYYRIPFINAQGLRDAYDLKRSDVRDRLLRKRPKHLVMFSDCCSNLTEPRVPPPLERKAFEVQEPPNTRPLFKHLFFEYSGVTVLTSCSRGEVSGFFGGGEGSLFTHAFRNYVDKNANRRCTWKRVAEVVGAEVRETYQIKYVQKGGELIGVGNVAQQKTQTVELIDKDARGPSLGLRVKQRGAELVILEVICGSRAEEAGVQANDVLLEVNQQKLDTEDAFGKKVDDSGPMIQLKVRRGGDVQSYDIMLDQGS